jgi:uncharacterized protein YcaQ
LIENLLPQEILDTKDPNETLEEYQAWHVERRINAMGLVHPNAGEQWGGMIGVKSPQRRKIFDQLINEDRIMRVEIKELLGDEFYLCKKDSVLLDRVINKRVTPRAAFIAPLDNLLWDRKSLVRLFDFHYIWEVYKPKKDRQYGYYVLPVLYGDRFIGRFDPAFDKKSRVLTINNWWWEDDFQPSEKSSHALSRCMKEFLNYLDATGIKFSKQLLQIGGLEWLGEFGS